MHLGVGRGYAVSWQDFGSGVDRGLDVLVAPSKSRLRSNCREIWLTRTNSSIIDDSDRNLPELTLEPAR